jgi:hypothetical protein
MTWDFDQPGLPDTPLERAIMLQNMIVGFSQNDGLDDETYAQLRAELLKGSVRNPVPDYIRICRTGD